MSSIIFRIFECLCGKNEENCEDVQDREVVNAVTVAAQVDEVVRNMPISKGEAVSPPFKKAIQFSPTVNVSDGSIKKLRVRERQPGAILPKSEKDDPNGELFYTEDDYTNSQRELSERKVIDGNLTYLENKWGGKEQPVDGSKAEGRALFGRSVFKSSDNIDLCLAAAIENASKHQAGKEVRDWQDLPRGSVRRFFLKQRINRHWNEAYAQKKAESKSNPEENLSVYSDS